MFEYTVGSSVEIHCHGFFSIKSPWNPYSNVKMPSPFPANNGFELAPRPKSFCRISAISGALRFFLQAAGGPKAALLVLLWVGFGSQGKSLFVENLIGTCLQVNVPYRHLAKEGPSFSGNGALRTNFWLGFCVCLEVRRVFEHFSFCAMYSHVPRIKRKVT